MGKIIDILAKQNSSPKILVVDDDEISATISVNGLQGGYETVWANSGEKAIAMCLEILPDLILLDIEMPGVSGIEVCQTLKKNPLVRHIPIMFLTSHTEPEQEEICWQAGCTDFINKPFSLSTLRHRVNARVNAKLMADALRRQSSVDGLTGLYNRRYVDEYLDVQIKQAARELVPLSVLMIDIDKFKPINDQYGHLIGDECLKHVAKVLSENVSRPLDCVGRFGGEEFLVVLPGTDIDGAISISKLILGAIREPFKLEKEQAIMTMSVSIGIALCQHGNATVTSLINEADKQLYRAKVNGRDQLQVSESSRQSVSN